MLVPFLFQSGGFLIFKSYSHLIERLDDRDIHLEKKRTLKMGNRQNVQVKLPQNDDETETRRQNLQSTRNKYQLQQPTFGLTDLEQRLVNIVNLPPMVS